MPNSARSQQVLTAYQEASTLCIYWDLFMKLHNTFSGWKSETAALGGSLLHSWSCVPQTLLLFSSISVSSIREWTACGCFLLRHLVSLVRLIWTLPVSCAEILTNICCFCDGDEQQGRSSLLFHCMANRGPPWRSGGQVGAIVIGELQGEVLRMCELGSSVWGRVCVKECIWPLVCLPPLTALSRLGGYE